jgi:hypothetical protein
MIQWSGKARKGKKTADDHNEFIQAAVQHSGTQTDDNSLWLSEARTNPGADELHRLRSHPAAALRHQVNLAGSTWRTFSTFPLAPPGRLA